MQDFDTRLIQYDLTPKDARPAFLALLFDDPVMRRAFRQMAEDRVTRAMMEFLNLDVIPYEDYKLLSKRGYVRYYGDFYTYIPAARGLDLPDVRLTQKGERFKGNGPLDYRNHWHFADFILAYRVRNTGKGLVAGRETLEEWIDEGNESCLNALVDPNTGGKLTSLTELGVFDICDPTYRKELIQLRAEKKAAYPLTASKLVHDVVSR